MSQPRPPRPRQSPWHHRPSQQHPKADDTESSLISSAAAESSRAVTPATKLSVALANKITETLVLMKALTARPAFASRPLLITAEAIAVLAISRVTVASVDKVMSAWAVKVTVALTNKVWQTRFRRLSHHGQSHCGVGHSQNHGGLDGQGHVGIVGQDRLCNRPAAQVIQSCPTAPAKPSVEMDPAMQSDPAMRQCTGRAIPGQVSMYERGHQGNRRQRPCDDVRPGPSPAKRQYMASTVQRKTASALKRDLPMGESTLSRSRWRLS